MLESVANVRRHLNPVLEMLTERKVEPKIKRESTLHVRELVSGSAFSEPVFEDLLEGEIEPT